MSIVRRHRQRLPVVVPLQREVVGSAFGGRPAEHQHHRHVDGRHWRSGQRRGNAVAAAGALPDRGGADGKRNAQPAQVHAVDQNGLVDGQRGRGHIEPRRGAVDGERIVGGVAIVRRRDRQLRRTGALARGDDDFPGSGGHI